MHIQVVSRHNQKERKKNKVKHTRKLTKKRKWNALEMYR